MQKLKIIISKNLRESLEQAIIQQPHDKLFVLTDETTYKKCWPVISGFPSMQQSEHIVIGATDEHKSIETLISVWTELSQKGGTRHSLLVHSVHQYPYHFAGHGGCRCRRKNRHQLQRFEK